MRVVIFLPLLRGAESGVDLYLSFQIIERDTLHLKFSENILYKGSPTRYFYATHWIGEPDLIAFEMTNTEKVDPENKFRMTRIIKGTQNIIYLSFL